jgi:hypothetical protein
MDVPPTYRDHVFADAVPMACARDHLDLTGGSPIPGHCEVCAACPVSHHLLRRWEFLAFHARAAYCAARPRRWRLVQGGIAIKFTDQGEVTAALAAKSRGLASPVAWITHDDPFMAPTVGRIAVGRPHPITMPSLAKDLGARVLGDRIIASQEHRAMRDNMVQ